MAQVLSLHAAERRQLAAWACDAYPHEACGLMLGVSEADGVRVLEVRRARNLNVERARDRYDIDPADYLAAEREATARGCELVGVWHTHPDHPARPSPTDLALAWPGWSYVIAAVTAAGMTELRAWRLNGGHQFDEESIEEADPS
ncbi:MAG: M67 family metallopeptidase [Rhodocyclales bacterium]|nr:M67 family metallopeptidase [Rhodocyclales bacterium]